jgi:uncharacterized membrane protein
MSTENDQLKLPSVVNEISEAAPEIWRPNNLAEWARYKKLQVILPVWAEQEKTDRIERRRVSQLIFGLLYLEVIAAIGLLIAIGLKYLDISVGLLQVLFPTLFAQIVGLAYLIVRSLFAKRENLRDLLEESETPAGDHVRQRPRAKS